MKENNNLFLSIGFIGILVAITGITMTISKTTPKLETVNTITQVPSSALFLDETIQSPNNNVADKKVSGVTLTPLVTENVKAVKSVKNIKALKLDLSRTISIYGPIGDNAHAAAQTIRTLNARNNQLPIYIVLYSPGGSVVDGATLISAMQVSEAPVYTVCYAFCASMASMIHQYGVKRYITDRSILMFHPASFGTEGEVDKMFSQISMIRRYINKMEMEVSNRMNLTFQQYKTLTATEYWVDSEDGLKANAADDIVYIVPTSLVNILPITPRKEDESEDKKNVKKQNNNIRSLQWIFKQ